MQVGTKSHCCVEVARSRSVDVSDQHPGRGSCSKCDIELVRGRTGHSSWAGRNRGSHKEGMRLWALMMGSVHIG